LHPVIPPSSRNLSGAAIMLVAVGSFSLMDASIKVLSPHYPAIQVTALRGLASLPIALLWVLLQGGVSQLIRVRLGLQVFRGILGIISLAAFTYGLRGLALSEAYSVFFVAPLLITLLAAVVLRERVGRGRWIAIGIGFGGVLIVLRPTGSGTVTLAGAAILAAAACYATSAVTVRVLGRTDSTPSMVFWTMLLVGLGAGAMALPTWRPVQAEHWKAIAAIAATGSLAQWALTEAFRRGEASFVAPFEYTALIWGILLDWTLWRTLPSGLTLAGASVIAACGVYLLRHERDHAEAEHP
jgi:drug/metabolite transporter (DMT)-like permease